MLMHVRAFVLAGIVRQRGDGAHDLLDRVLRLHPGRGAFRDVYSWLGLTVEF